MGPKRTGTKNKFQKIKKNKNISKSTTLQSTVQETASHSTAESNSESNKARSKQLSIFAHIVNLGIF